VCRVGGKNFVGIPSHSESNISGHPSVGQTRKLRTVSVGGIELKYNVLSQEPSPEIGEEGGGGRGRNGFKKRVGYYRSEASGEIFTPLSRLQMRARKEEELQGKRLNTWVSIARRGGYKSGSGSWGFPRLHAWGGGDKEIFVKEQQRKQAQMQKRSDNRDRTKQVNVRCMIKGKWATRKNARGKGCRTNAHKSRCSFATRQKFNFTGRNHGQMSGEKVKGISHNQGKVWKGVS